MRKRGGVDGGINVVQPLTADGGFVCIIPLLPGYYIAHNA